MQCKILVTHREDPLTRALPYSHWMTFVAVEHLAAPATGQAAHFPLDFL